MLLVLALASPVAILATITAHPAASAGRFSPFGPLGMPILLLKVGFYIKGGLDVKLRLSYLPDHPPHHIGLPRPQLHQRRSLEG